MVTGRIPNPTPSVAAKLAKTQEKKDQMRAAHAEKRKQLAEKRAEILSRADSVK